MGTALGAGAGWVTPLVTAIPSEKQVTATLRDTGFLT